jgi:uncharacterized protein (TIGR03000 family)
MFRLLSSLSVLASLTLSPVLVAQVTGQGQSAQVTVKVPADAKVRFNDHLTTQTGETRTFVTPPLADGTKKYTYTIKATFLGADGKEVTVEEKVSVSPGIVTAVDLTKGASSQRTLRMVADDSYGLRYPESWRTTDPPRNIVQGPGNATVYTSPSRSYGYSRYDDPTYRPSVGEHWVNGYRRSNGTYVQGHWQTNPDDSFWNDYSSSGIMNPHTGRMGNKLPPAGGASSRYGR